MHSKYVSCIISQKLHKIHIKLVIGSDYFDTDFSIISKKIIFKTSV